jgi:hypothetical protein
MHIAGLMPFSLPEDAGPGFLQDLMADLRAPRGVVALQVPIPRLRAIAQGAGGTLNDVVLSVCGGALRRFLVEDGTLPDRPLTASVPVSVRPADDEGTGNAITFIVASMATNVEGARDRLAAVVASTKLAKAHAQTLPRDAMTPYTMLLMAPSWRSMRGTSSIRCRRRCGVCQLRGQRGRLRRRLRRRRRPPKPSPPRRSVLRRRPPLRSPRIREAPNGIPLLTLTPYARMGIKLLLSKQQPRKPIK